MSGEEFIEQFQLVEHGKVLAEVGHLSRCKKAGECIIVRAQVKSSVLVSLGRTRPIWGRFKVMCDATAVQKPVIPAKAGIQWVEVNNRARVVELDASPGFPLSRE
jgi:hypothetical protein